jgi:hypothetical protein
MAKQVSSWMSDDGRVYASEIEALRADVAYWKGLGERWLTLMKANEEKDRQRQPYLERGSHQ